MRTPGTPKQWIRLLVVAAAFSALPALAQNKALDEQTFHEFEQIVADFSTAERIQAWEAFIQKYPSSTFVPQVKQVISELRGEKRPTASATPKPKGADSDLDFLSEPSETPTPAPRPTQQPVVFAPTPRPVATPTAAPANPFMDTGTGRPRGGGNNTASTERYAWNTDGGATPSSTPSAATGNDVYPDRRGGITRPPRRSAGIGKATHTEVGFTVGFAPDETYVRNILVGMTATQRFGRTWGASVEAWGAQSSETPLLRSLRNLGAEPEVISKYNWIAGGTAEANLLSAIDRVTGQIPNRNDLYVRGGGGIVNTDLEICREEGGVQCAAPLFIEGVNFGYLTAGLGHRFYVTRWMTFRSEMRSRTVFELIDGKYTPRSNIQLNLGPTFVF